MKKKELDHIGAENIRKLLDKANEEGIKKENIVQIIYHNSSCIMVYEK